MHRDDMVPLVAMLFPLPWACGPRGRSRDAIPTPLPYVSVAPPSLVTLPHFFDNAVYFNRFKAHGSTPLKRGQAAWVISRSHVGGRPRCFTAGSGTGKVSSSPIVQQ